MRGIVVKDLKITSALLFSSGIDKIEAKIRLDTSHSRDDLLLANSEPTVQEQ